MKLRYSFFFGITNIRRIFKLFTFSCFVVRADIDTFHALLLADLAHGTTLLITQAGEFAVMTVDTGC